MKNLVDTLKDPLVVGSALVAGATLDPNVAGTIAQAPEIVSAVMTVVTFIFRFFAGLKDSRLEFERQRLIFKT